MKLYLNNNASPNDPYFSSGFPNDEILVAVNTKHIHFNRINGGAIGVCNFLMDCVYDAIAEWKAMKNKVVKHDTVKYLKDGLLRLEVSEESDSEG